MPEKPNPVPKPLENGKLSEESALLVSKIEANKQSYAFIKIFQYTKFSDYL